MVGGDLSPPPHQIEPRVVAGHRCNTKNKRSRRMRNPAQSACIACFSPILLEIVPAAQPESVA
ncbi:hypothetical protein C6Y62_03440 [Hyphomicrobium sulfonivorans]|nr:hypothetical protein [Hyphomicrobium sulfonivorans]